MSAAPTDTRLSVDVDVTTRHTVHISVPKGKLYSVVDLTNDICAQLDLNPKIYVNEVSVLQLYLLSNKEQPNFLNTDLLARNTFLFTLREIQTTHPKEAQFSTLSA